MRHLRSSVAIFALVTASSAFAAETSETSDEDLSGEETDEAPKPEPKPKSRAKDKAKDGAKDKEKASPKSKTKAKGVLRRAGAGIGLLDPLPGFLVDTQLGPITMVGLDYAYLRARSSTFDAKASYIGLDVKVLFGERSTAFGGLGLGQRTLGVKFKENVEGTFVDDATGASRTVAADVRWAGSVMQTLIAPKLGVMLPTGSAGALTLALGASIPLKAKVSLEPSITELEGQPLEEHSTVREDAAKYAKRPWPLLEATFTFFFKH